MRRYPELALLDSDDAVLAHEPCHPILGTAYAFGIVELVPNPGTAVPAIVLQKDPSNLNHELVVCKPSAA